MNSTRPNWWTVNIGSGHGLVPSGNKPLSQSIWTQIYMTSLGHNELINEQSVWISIIVNTQIRTTHAVTFRFHNGKVRKTTEMCPGINYLSKSIYEYNKTHVNQSTIHDTFIFIHGGSYLLKPKTSLELVRVQPEIQWDIICICNIVCAPSLQSCLRSCHGWNAPSWRFLSLVLNFLKKHKKCLCIISQN